MCSWCSCSLCVLPASTCPKLSCSISQPIQSLSLPLSLSISVYLAHLIFHSGWKLQLHRQRCMWSFSLSAILCEKNLQCFAICAFPVSVAVARSQTRNWSPSRSQIRSLYAANVPLCTECFLCCTVAVSSTEPGHAWELLTKQTAQQGQSKPRKGNARYGVCMPHRRIGIGRIGYTAHGTVGCLLMAPADRDNILWCVHCLKCPACHAGSQETCVGLCTAAGK